MSGETVHLETLTENARQHISQIERLVETSDDYFKVYKLAFAPLKEGKSFTAASLHDLHNSAYYKVILDLVQRHWKKTLKG